MEPRFGLRRDAPFDPSDAGEDDALVARIREEIAERGPITFARFMELALYDPAGGYYRGDEARPGRAGDFLTAPEAHPIFGWAIARQLDEIWRLLGTPERFVVREAGAGSGALAAAIVDGLRREGLALAGAIRYEPVEIEPIRLDQFRARLDEIGLGDVVDAPGKDPITGVVVANEVLDALPVHRLERRDGRLREVFVDWRDGAFTELLGEPSTALLEGRLETEGISLVDGQRAEVSLAVDDWIRDAASWLDRGVLLVIDYGYPARELYDAARRPGGTLRAYLRHRVHDDPYRHVGRQDLTAHVDLTAVERAALASGLEQLGMTTQAEFLAGLDAGGLLVSLQADPATTLQSYLAARGALMRMLDPAATGRFQVMGFGRGLPEGSLLRGFSFRLRR